MSPTASPRPAPSLIAREDGPPTDFARLRRQRFERVLEEMDRHDLDVLILGRDGNTRYATGVRRLWLAGTRPFGPGCVIVRRTSQVYLISMGDDGVPPEIPRENLLGLSWNPMAYVEKLAGIEGVPEARRIGVDGMTPMFAQLLPAVAGEAELTDAEEVLRGLRMVKLPEEVACIRSALAVAEGALLETARGLRPGVSEPGLRGVFLEQVSRYGLSIPALEGTFSATPRAADGDGLPLRRLVGPRPVVAGDLVACHAGVLHAGYEGSLARTWPCPGASGGVGEPVAAGHEALLDRWRGVMTALREACRPGNSGAQLRDAYEGAGEPLPPVPIAHGLGLGFEAPVIGTAVGRDLDAAWELRAGMVLNLQAYTWSAGVGGYLGSEVVHVTDDGPEQLTRLAHGPLG